MVGRNELCPCGSGKKYKKCCLLKDEKIEISKNKIGYSKKQYDGIMKKVMEFAEKEEYSPYKSRCEIDFGINTYQLENTMNTYYLTNYKYNKQSSIMMEYFNRYKNSLNKNETSIIEKVLNSYMSLYQIKEKNIDKILLKDIILNENIYVEDLELFKGFEVGDYALARIINVEDINLLLDRTIKVDEVHKENIKSILEDRYKETRKKVKSKKQNLINNIKFMYKKLIEIYMEEIKLIEEEILSRKYENSLSKENLLILNLNKNIEDNKQKIILNDLNNEIILVSKASEEKIMEEKPLLDNIVEEKNIEIKKEAKQTKARLAEKSNYKNKKQIDSRLEDKLKQRLERTKKILQKKEEKVEDIKVKKEEFESYQEHLKPKLEAISITKIDKIESKIENNIVAKMGIIPIKEKDIKNQQIAKYKDLQINSQDTKINKTQQKTKIIEYEDCKIYNILVSKIESQYKDKCIALWKKLKKSNKMNTGSESGWAAAIEYSVKKSIDEGVTQSQISKKYNISSKTISKRYKEILIC